MKLQIGYSPCPNDTFIFDAMVHGKVDTEGLTFEPMLADVEELNILASAKTYPVTKLSYHALAHLQDSYRLFDSGSALGEGIGPLLIAKSQLSPKQVASHPVAIPGKFTTAAFLFRLAYPEATELHPIIFNEIEAAIASGDVASGVIIHENRFTYAERGFELLMDLGAFWETETQLPIPLGGIVVRRDLPVEEQARIGRVLRRSVDYAMAHPQASAAYVAAHAQEMSPEIQYKHIKTYVNEYSVSLGERGRAAVVGMFEMAVAKGIIEEVRKDLFV
ncbi:MAG: menaquinone biosynthesis family protein [Saprospiraceae bacterium]